MNVDAVVRGGRTLIAATVLMALSASAGGWPRSPSSTSSVVGQVVTPTLLAVGEEDRRKPPTEALQFYHALKLRGVPTALVLVPEASHSSLGARPSQLNAIVQVDARLVRTRVSASSAHRSHLHSHSPPSAGSRGRRTIDSTATEGLQFVHTAFYQANLPQKMTCHLN